MKQKKVEVLYREWLPGQLVKKDISLIQAALKAAENAYAPYSGFRVGAAALLSDGTIVTGNNQENAAYPSGLCAERVALFYIQSQFPGKSVSAMAIAAVHKGKQTSDPIYPCGSCRQVMLEHETIHHKPIRLLFAGAKKVIEVDSTSALLPFHFTGSVLKKKSE